ncbi:MAG: hypothetical protein HDS71_04595 [Bacteroidales bacterium]|nr:hypothetical protein [Bacteroidales bacterium]MBD5223315.1 hypothetical protein [Bacteroidales bacterium]MBD5301394.1 hypothetical protein [Bacteroides sp.]
MKTINKIIGTGSMVAMMLAMTGCAQEDIFQPSEAGLPQASDYQIGVSVDDLNNVELSILDKNGNPAKGVYPVWYVNQSERPSTALTYRNLFTIAGEYPVEMKVGNGSGVSEGSVNGSFTITKTIFDFEPYMRALTNGSTKEWAVDGTKDGNMGCGPAENPTEWWKGGPGAKEQEGVYGNTLIFGDNGSATSGTYVFDPGTSGTFYVNTGVHSLPGYQVNNPDNGADFRVASGVVTSSFTLSPEGANLYLVLPENTPFPYVPSEEAFAAPKYRITNFSRNEITLVQDLDGISWQYIISPKAEADVTTTGFKYDYEHNLWKDAHVWLQETWFADDGWTEIDGPEVTFNGNNGFSLHTPANMGNTQWQGQVKVGTDIELHADATYDFSCKVNVPKAGVVTAKLQKSDDNNTFIKYVNDSKTEVDPNGSIIWFSDMQGFDGNLMIVFDFAGYSDCDIEVSDIVLKEHQYDDGTIIPASASMPNISDADNLFADYKVVHYSTWFADENWSDAAVKQPEIIFFPDGYSFIAPEGFGSTQWQGQVHVWTDIEISAENKYDFMLTIESDRDVDGVTVKIQKGDTLGGDDHEADDAVAFGEDRVDVEAGVPYIYYFKGKKGFDTKNLQVCMDYAGAPSGTNITVSDIKMQVAK